MNDTRYLWMLADQIAAVIVRWLKEHENKDLYVRFKRIDMLRLTRLQVWSWRHMVSIEEILTLTLPYLRKSLSSRQKSSYGLGCSIAALTGVGNEKILIEALRLRYPGGEYRDIWREQERRRQLEAEATEDSDGLHLRVPTARGLLDYNSTADFLSSYRARVIGQRIKMNNSLNGARRKRKKYRGNPWL